MNYLLPWLEAKFTKRDGTPLAFGSLQSFYDGSDTPAPTYGDASNTDENDNPIKLDASGYASVWLDPDITYKFKLFDSNGTLVRTKEGVTNGGSGASASDGKIKVTASDTNSDYLGTKLTEGDNVTLTVNNNILGDTLGSLLITIKLKLH